MDREVLMRKKILDEHTQQEQQDLELIAAYVSSRAHSVEILTFTTGPMSHQKAKSAMNKITLLKHETVQRDLMKKACRFRNHSGSPLRIARTSSGGAMNSSLQTV